MLKQLVLLSFFCTQLVGMSWCNLCFMSTLLRKAVLIFLYFSISLFPVFTLAKLGKMHRLKMLYWKHLNGYCMFNSTGKSFIKF